MQHFSTLVPSPPPPPPTQIFTNTHKPYLSRTNSASSLVASWPCFMLWQSTSKPAFFSPCRGTNKTHLLLASNEEQRTKMISASHMKHLHQGKQRIIGTEAGGVSSILTYYTIFILSMSCTTVQLQSTKHLCKGRVCYLSFCFCITSYSSILSWRQLLFPCLEVKQVVTI